jgi:hypothetical protein
MNPDTAKLKEGEWWYSFLCFGEKAGYELIRVEAVDAGLLFRHVTRFFVQDWGLNDFDARITLPGEGLPEFTELEFRTGGGAGLSRAKREGSSLTGTVEQDEGSREVNLEVEGLLVPSYFISHLASTLPLEPGASVSFRTLHEGGLEVPDETAVLACQEHEEIKVKEEPVGTWRFGGETLGSYWIRDDRVVLRNEYGPTSSVLALKEEALRGLPTEVEELGF